MTNTIIAANLPPVDLERPKKTLVQRLSKVGCIRREREQDHTILVGVSVDQGKLACIKR